MSRITIHRFRAALAGPSAQSPLVRAYRKLARRPELAAGVVHNEWALWSDNGTPAVMA